ncbi:MAG: poly-beta-1,6-N-acetyl-D-glucosamine biosynthesis protein PgaD [bacterium]|nr:poly-beta-1,6-N-acetyl-D-glucosamine biosynthesis protein PgaD [bacterium]
MKKKLSQEQQEKEIRNKEFRNELIIEAPGLQSLKQRYSSKLMTLLFWLLWFYLLNPLLSIFAWLFGFKVFYDNMVLLGGWPGLMEKVNAYVVTLLVMGIVFFGWAFYNNARFYNKKRRGKLWKVNTLNLSTQFNISRNEVMKAKSARRIVINFDEGGNITHFSNEKMKKD